MVSLRQMTPAEFNVFSEYSVCDYANGLVASPGIDASTAAEKAWEEFTDMLPNGPDTPGNALMIIEADCRPVGVIWYLYEVTDGVHHVFLSDFVIAPAERRKGYAAAALFEMEKDAAIHGCIESRLHVWNGNSAALNLYAKCGYIPLRHTDDGVYMKKVLK